MCADIVLGHPILNILMLVKFKIYQAKKKMGYMSKIPLHMASRNIVVPAGFGTIYFNKLTEIVLQLKVNWMNMLMFRLRDLNQQIMFEML